MAEVTLDGVGLGELGEVHDELLGEGVPFLAVVHPEVDVCAGELVYVKLKASVLGDAAARFARRTLEVN